MQRPAIFGATVLAVFAYLTAGCGGSALQAKARRVVGDPHAAVVGTQTVDPLGGGRLAIVVMKPGGSQGLGCGVAQAQPVTDASTVSGCPRWSDAYVRLGARTHADMGDLGISKWQVAAIARARATSPRFQMFPIVNQLTIHCAIPDSGRAGGTLPGMCATVANPFGKPVRCVTFTEGWRPAAKNTLQTAAWVVRFSRGGHVQSTSTEKHAPQPWAVGGKATC